VVMGYHDVPVIVQVRDVLVVVHGLVLGSKSSFSIALICTTGHRIPASASTNQGSEKRGPRRAGRCTWPGLGAQGVDIWGFFKLPPFLKMTNTHRFGGSWFRYLAREFRVQVFGLRLRGVGLSLEGLTDLV